MLRHLSIARIIVAAATVLAVVLAAQDYLLAAPTVQLTAGSVSQAAPTAPDDPAWDSAPAIVVPLTAQAAVPPALTQPTVMAARIRAVHDGQTIAFLVEWADPTRDALSIGPNQFRDAAALQFGVGNALPALCMGTPVGLANLWHWKADWQEDIDKGFQDLTVLYPNFWKDYYPYVTTGQPPFNVAKDFTSDGARAYLIGQAVGNSMSSVTRASPVEEMLSAGFGTATTKTVQGVNGRGTWQNGTWRVVFTRPLTVQDTATPSFAVGKTISVAVAVWNGANREVGGRKQVSNFVTLAIGERGVSEAPAGAAAAKPGSTSPVVTAPAAPRPSAAVTGAWIGPSILSFLLLATLISAAAIAYVTRPTRRW